MRHDSWHDFEFAPLVQMRDRLTSEHQCSDLRAELLKILHGTASEVVQPLQDLRNVLDSLRDSPPGFERLRSMNTFVRTLGERRNLAQLLDILRQAYSDQGSERALAARSQKGRMHCIYGWSGQTILLASNPDPTAGTEAPRDDMDAFLGYPPAEWDMSIHIWQPNPQAVGFQATKRIEPGVIAEPPHSHPFSFVSHVSAGSLRESLYEVDRHDAPPQANSSGARYGGKALQQVDGVWPPHQEYRPTRLRTVEDRVVLKEGDSYYLPCHAIHDVEVDQRTAAVTPAITLFLCAEATVKPNAYLTDDMARYHQENPTMKDVAVPLSGAEWDAKLAAVSGYLRGDSPQLRLEDVFTCNSTYGFMHVHGDLP